MTGPQGAGPFMSRLSVDTGPPSFSDYDDLLMTMGLMWFDRLNFDSDENAVPMGGTITESGGVRQHAMLTSEIFWTGKTSPLSVNMLVQGGGGSAGRSAGSRENSGGGGGAVPTIYNGDVVDGLTATIGAGGLVPAGIGPPVPQGNDGGTSTAVQIDGTSLASSFGGSGGGASDAPPTANGRSNHGGGGGGGSARTPVQGTGGAGNDGAGNGTAGAGAAAAGDGRGGGGGGAGGNATPTPIANGVVSDGGPGWQWTAASGGDDQYYGGGGGGSAGDRTPGVGGIGGGGAGGGFGTNPGAGVNGTANTGGGGGGGRDTNTGGGHGGSGVVKIRFAYPFV